MPGTFENSVFINCPIDDEYQPLFHAIVFTVHDCGFTPRSALELVDSGQNRFEKIAGLIKNCKFGVHDLSRTQIDPKLKLPRFNMPLELGLDLGARLYGSGKLRQKKHLILDSDRYRYRGFISDLAGIDPEAHSSSVEQVIECVRNWLVAQKVSPQSVPGAKAVQKRYYKFQRDLLRLCKNSQLEPDEIQHYADFINMLEYWLTENR